MPEGQHPAGQQEEQTEDGKRPVDHWWYGLNAPGPVGDDHSQDDSEPEPEQVSADVGVFSAGSEL